MAFMVAKMEAMMEQLRTSRGGHVLVASAMAKPQFDLTYYLGTFSPLLIFQILWA